MTKIRKVKKVNNPSAKFTLEDVELKIQFENQRGFEIDEYGEVATPQVTMEAENKSAVLLFGEMELMASDINESYFGTNIKAHKSYYRLSKALPFNTTKHMTEIGNKYIIPVTINWIKARMGTMSISFRRGKAHSMKSLAMDEMPNQIISKVEGAQYFIFCDDFPILEDYQFSYMESNALNAVSYHLLSGEHKQRNLHKCKECKVVYRNSCKCTGHHKMQGYHSQKGSHKYYDFNGGLVEIATSSFNKDKVAKERKAFIGLEVEMELQRGTKSRNDQTLKLARLCKKLGGAQFAKLFHRFEGDSSLDYGVEMISMPFSSDYYLNHKEAFEALSVGISKYKIMGHNDNLRDSRVGAHCHISRDAFASEAHLYRFFKLQFQSVEQAHALSGRGNRMYNTIGIPSYDYESDGMKDMAQALGLNHAGGYTTNSKLKRMAKQLFAGYHIGGKSCWWNLGANNTFEYRLPAGQFDKRVKGKDKRFSKFCVNLEYVFASYDYTKNVNAKDANFESFIHWLNKNKTYRNLLEAIKSDEHILNITFGAGKFMSGNAKEEDLQAIEEVAKFQSDMKKESFSVVNTGGLEQMLSRGNAIVKMLQGNGILNPSKVKDKVDAFRGNKKKEFKDE